MTTIFASVSFLKVPLTEIGEFGNRILARGWEDYDDRVDPWAVKYRKDFPRDTPATEAEAELAEIMGDYWVSGDDIGALHSARLRPETDGEF